MAATDEDRTARADGGATGEPSKAVNPEPAPEPAPGPKPASPCGGHNQPPCK